jgi:hypothetical protein
LKFISGLLIIIGGLFAVGLMVPSAPVEKQIVADDCVRDREFNIQQFRNAFSWLTDTGGATAEDMQTTFEQLCRTGTAAVEAKKMVDGVLQSAPRCIIAGRMELPSKCPKPHCSGAVCTNLQGTVILGVNPAATGQLANLARDIAAAKGARR